MNKKDEFNNWLDKFIEEKGISLEETFSLEVDGVGHLFDYENILDQIKTATDKEKKGIKTMLIKLDYENRDIKAYLRHLAVSIAKLLNAKVLGIESEDVRDKIDRMKAKEDLIKLDLICKKILDIDFKNKKTNDIKDKIISSVNDKAFDLIKEYQISSDEYLELLEQNKDYKRLEERKQRMADDRYNMIWDSCSPKEIADILRGHYDYSDQEIIDEFEDEETKEDIKKYLEELKEIEEASKNVVLDNGYTFVFENEYCFSKLKSLYEDNQRLSKTPDGIEFATITNSDVTKEAFLVNYGEDIEIVYNFYNKSSKEMESYENELFDMSNINSKEELIEKMKEKLEHFEEKYNKLEQDEENMEVQ